MFKKNTIVAHLKVTIVMAVMIMVMVHSAPTGLRHRELLIGNARSGTTTAQQCPTGNGFNYYSRTPNCKINYKCAVGMQEFSTPCGCGCQPKKCGGNYGACPSTHVCNKGACFLKK